MNIMIERLKRMPQRCDECWQGGFFRMPAWVDEGEVQPFRPYALGWIAVKADLIFMGEVAEVADNTIVLKSLADFAGDKMVGGYRPGRVEVACQELFDEICEPLAEGGIVAELRQELPSFDKMVDMMALKMSDTQMPGMLSAKGVTIDRMKAFAEAAREYYLAAPWEVFSSDDLIEIESPFIDGALRYAMIMGQGQDFYGIGFYSDIKTVRAAVDGIIRPEITRDGIWHLSFDDEFHMSAVDLHFWERYKLPLADEDAYPLVCLIGSRKPRRPGPDFLAWFEGLMRAIVKCRDEATVSDRCIVTAETANGPMQFVLSFTNLGNNVTGGPLLAPKAAMERHFLDMLSGEDLLSTPKTRKPSKPRNPAVYGTIDSDADRKAQYMMYDAWEMSGRRQIGLARKALEISANCADAYVLLASHVQDPAKALDIYRAGVEAGRRSLGSKRFKDDAGHFWGLLETRPFMRAMCGMGECLCTLGRLDEARECYDEMLRLNPNDNQGVRWTYALMLIRFGRDDDAMKLIERYKDDDCFALWRYCRALIAFHHEGDTTYSRKLMYIAMEKNRHLAAYLANPDLIPDEPMDGFTVGSPEEAQAWVYELMPIVLKTPGMKAWISDVIKTPRKKQEGGRQGRRRKDNT